MSRCSGLIHKLHIAAVFTVPDREAVADAGVFYHFGLVAVIGRVGEIVDIKAVAVLAFVYRITLGMTSRRYHGFRVLMRQRGCCGKRARTAFRTNFQRDAGDAARSGQRKLCITVT